MATAKMSIALVVFLVYHIQGVAGANVALHKYAEANATCGSPREEFYSITERFKKPRQRILSICDASNETLSHNASNLVDGDTLTWWQSPASVDKVAITIDLLGGHHKYFYLNDIKIRFGEYYRPGQLVFYKSTNYGASYEPFHYFVNSADDCQEKFGISPNSNPVSVDDVLCMPYISEPLEKNEVVTLPIVGPRGDPKSPSNSLLEWMNATNIRLNFMSLQLIFDYIGDIWYHYAVREVEVDAYCLCNGQGDGLDCEYNETAGDNVCKCQTGACGIDCSYCCPAYNQYPWQKGSRGPLFADEDAACQPCNCHNHSSVCAYNETIARMNKSLDIYGNFSGGGVCENCQDNTEGINCERCAPFYYRPKSKSQWEKDACHDCNCSVAGTKNLTLPGVLYLDCLKDENTTAPYPGMEPGDCICKNNTMGRRCDRCKHGFFNLSAENPKGCQECTCRLPGTVNGSNVCEPNQHGHCPCKQNVQGAHCEICKDTYYDLQENNTYGCTECDCDIGGSVGAICNKASGQCICKPHVTLRQCNSPQNEFYFPTLHFITGNSSHIVTTEQGNQTWTTRLDIIDGVNSSSFFILLLSYISQSNISVEVTLDFNSGVVTHLIHLDSCHEACNMNLSAFGVLTLSGSVVVNVTYNSVATWFSPIKVVALPREFYQPTRLANSTMDDFLANCSVVQFNTSNLDEFCRSQVFSLTINYLGKALSCDCDVTGSLNNSCNPYGGQCHCKEGVTGRTCGQCMAGFYNFTSEGCSACECEGDHKICDVMSGQCKCPPNTEGRVCNQCSHTFWGWNQTTGCQACNCSSIGSVNPQCNLTTGLCSCKPAVQGDKCTECMDGYKNISSSGCSRCSCNEDGSLSEVCNKSSGQCLCKDNAVGMLCDRCESGYFYLNSGNPDGCTGCVCMGITDNCTSTTSYRQMQNIELSAWSLGSDEFLNFVSVSQVPIMDDHGNPLAMIGANISSNVTLYWRTNNNFTGTSLVEAYGGNFTFKLYFTQLLNGTLDSAVPKVMFKGVKNISIEQNLTAVPAGQVTMRHISMTEMLWVHSSDRSNVSREEFLLVLAKVERILITASFYVQGEGQYQTRLGDVQIAAVETTPSQAGQASDVEQCHCGPGYSGLSCERCARSYHRVNVSSDPFLGQCVPCDCNGHSLDCDPATGQCLNCEHNTTGFYCELCLDGFYGNATDGTPEDCKKCPCESPRTVTDLCVGDPLTGEPRCLNCSEGYKGRICGSCVIGFFGEPLSPGGNCSRCQCNNNSDVCNSTTGECLDCQYNTTGFYCERCENGTFGNATEQQCQVCSCDGVGAYHNVCNHRTGQCECKPNVGGLNCSRCQPYSYNFSSSGCTPCGCNVFGSSSLQCNESGVCECSNHTLGVKCDLCEWGFFGLPNATCQECNCNASGAYNASRCDRVTGQCDCKPGVTSRICDRCMIQHTNFSEIGCDPCPLCSRLGLQGDINTTLTVLREAEKDAETVSNLKLLWPELERVEDLINQTKESAEVFERLVTSLQHNITQLKNNTSNKTVTDLQRLLTNISAQSERLENRLSQELNRIQDFNTSTQSARGKITAANALVGEILVQMRNMKNHSESLLQAVTSLLNNSYDSEQQQVNEEVARVESVYALAMTAKYNVSRQTNMSHDLNNTALQLEASLIIKQRALSDLSPGISAVANASSQILKLVNETKSLISNASVQISDAESLLESANEMLNTSEEHITYGDHAYQNASQLLGGSGGLTEQRSALDDAIVATEQNLSAANHSVQENATKHAADLTAEAEERQRVFNTTLSHGERAVDAIETFEKVVQLGNQSLETSRQTNQSLQEIMDRLENITLVSSSLEIRVKTSKDAGEALLNQTLDRDVNLPGLKANVSASNQTFTSAESTGKAVDSQYSELQSARESLLQSAEGGSSPPSLVAHVKEANDWSAEAVFRSDPVNNGAQAIINRVESLEKKIQFINESVEKAGSLLPVAFNSVKNASVSVGDVANRVQQAEDLKRITANLQEEIKRNMSTLADKLKRAKEFVAKIRLALKVQGDTVVEYRPPDRALNESYYTEISVDFRPSRVQGTLFYLSEGPDNVDRMVSLTLEYGSYVKFSYNLGVGPIDIVNWAVKVNSGHWYTAYATRYESSGRLTVTDHSANFSRTYESDSDLINPYLYTDFSSTNLLYIGGLPDGHMVNKSDRFFDGCVDNVVVNQQLLELWNPVRVEGNRSFCSRRPAAALSPGTSFFGTPIGHVKQKMGDFNITGHSEIEFQFRTFFDTALILSVMSGENYVYGVYLNMSRVVFYFKDGNRTYTLQSNRSSYSDGRWYRLHVVRGLANSSLTVRPVGPSDDGAVDHSTIITQGPIFLHSGQSLLFGGKDPNSPINAPVGSSFAGGLRYINISSSSSGGLVSRILNSANLTESYKGVDFSGTLPQVENGTRFLGHSYAAVETGQETMSELIITFKTLSPSGLLIFWGGGPYFCLFLFHGNIYMIYSSNLTNYQPVMSNGETLNDGAYHTVTIQFSALKTEVFLDGQILSGPEIPNGPVPLNGSLFIGGVDEIATLSQVLPVVLPFEGDMLDIRVDLEPVDVFSGRSERVSKAGVPPERVVAPTAEPTTPPPTLPPPTCGSPYPPLRNSTEQDSVRLGFDDSYIAFSPSEEVLGNLSHRFVLSVTFRSLVPDGLLLYAADDLQNPAHFISLELVGGAVIFKYSANSAIVKVVSPASYYAEGGVEYTAQALRIDQFGALLISSIDYSKNRENSTTPELLVKAPFYYGGVPPGTDVTNLEGKGIGFIGCLRTFKIQYTMPVTLETVTKTFNPQIDRDEQKSSYKFKPCYAEIQSQAGFSGNGYILFNSNYTLPKETEIGISFRSTTRSGLLLSITNNTESDSGSLTLEQLEGQVVLIFNTKHNSSVIRWTDPSITDDGQYNASFHLCDNLFHDIKVKRFLEQVELIVDNHPPVLATIPTDFSLILGKFYIGGVPAGSGSQSHSGLSHKGLTGCVESLFIESRAQDLLRSTILIEVQQGCNAPRT